MSLLNYTTISLIILLSISFSYKNIVSFFLSFHSVRYTHSCCKTVYSDALTKSGP